MMLTAGLGDVLRLRNFRHYGEDRSWVEFKHNNKKKVFLALLIGEENFDAAPFASEADVEKMLNRLGWVRKDSSNAGLENEKTAETA